MSEKIKLYRPSNGTEGEIFMSKFCEKCDLCNADGEVEPCFIVGDALTYNVDDERYPKEWTYDSENNPTCTAFREIGEEEIYRCSETPDMFGEELI